MIARQSTKELLAESLKELSQVKAVDKITIKELMWDNFPEAVMITQKSREIVAVNKKAAEYGVQVGIKCSSMGKPESHKGCQCNKACDTGELQICTYEGQFVKVRQALWRWRIKFALWALTRRLMKWKFSLSRKVITELFWTNF